MNVKDIFELGLKLSVKADPRGAEGVKEYLDQVKKEYENVNELIEHFSDKERYSLAIFDGYDYHVGIIFDKHVKKDKNGKIIDGYIFSQEGLESPFIRVSKISEIMQMKYGNNGKMYKKFEVLQGTKSFMPHMSEMELNNAHNAFKIIHKN